jgi:hypothetical protein
MTITRWLGGSIAALMGLYVLAPTVALGLRFPPTGNRGGPARTAGGGVRGGGECLAQRPATLTAIAPEDNLVKTLDPQPVLYWFLPQTTARAAELKLMDESGELVYTAQLALPEAMGVIQMQLPSSVQLRPDETYRWSLRVLCEGASDPQSIRLQTVRGLIQRVELDEVALADIEAVSDPLLRAEQYAAAGLWSETAAIAAELYAQQPEAWQDLMDSVNLSAIADAPLLDCCAPLDPSLADPTVESSGSGINLE